MHAHGADVHIVQPPSSACRRADHYDNNDIISRLKALCGRLEGLLMHVGSDLSSSSSSAGRAAFRSEWSSPLSGRGRGRMFRIDGLAQELAMVGALCLLFVLKYRTLCSVTS